MSDPRELSQPINSFAFLFLACLLLCGIAAAAPAIALSRKSGPPTSKILVSGRGFQPNVGVDIYFGTKDEALVVTNGGGGFENAKIYAPRSAHPGKHWVTALERNNDKGAQEPFLVQTNWRQFHRADMMRLNPYENVLNPTTVGRLQLKWSFAVINGIPSSPAIANGVVYFSSGFSDYKVYALNARTGAKLWSSSYGIGDTPPAVANGVVYVGGGWNVYALNARTGAKLWSYATGYDVVAPPTVANGVVYIGSYDGNVYALDASTGAELWIYTIGGGTGGYVAASGRCGQWYCLCPLRGCLVRIERPHWHAALELRHWQRQGQLGFLARSGKWGGVCRLGERQRLRTQRQHRHPAVELCHERRDILVARGGERSSLYRFVGWQRVRT